MPEDIGSLIEEECDDERSVTGIARLFDTCNVWINERLYEHRKQKIGTALERLKPVIDALQKIKSAGFTPDIRLSGGVPVTIDTGLTIPKPHHVLSGRFEGKPDILVDHYDISPVSRVVVKAWGWKVILTGGTGLLKPPVFEPEEFTRVLARGPDSIVRYLERMAPR